MHIVTQAKLRYHKVRSAEKKILLKINLFSVVVVIIYVRLTVVSLTTQ